MTDELITQIRAALAADADDLTRQRGVKACRNVLAVLDATPGQPMQPPTPTPTPTPVVASPLATAAQAMASAPPGAVLEAVIAKLKSHLETSDISTSQPEPLVLRIPFIPLPKMKGGSS